MSIEIDKLNRLHAATTPGEWSNDASEYVWYSDSHDLICDCRHRDCPRDEENANAAWIAAAHNAWPEIAAELQRLLRLEGDAIGIAANIQEQANRVGNPGRPGISAVTNMADEILQLRVENARLTNFVTDVREAFGAQRDFGIAMKVEAAIERLESQQNGVAN